MIDYWWKLMNKNECKVQRKAIKRAKLQTCGTFWDFWTSQNGFYRWTSETSCRLHLFSLKTWHHSGETSKSSIDLLSLRRSVSYASVTSVSVLKSDLSFSWEKKSVVLRALILLRRRISLNFGTRSRLKLHVRSFPLTVRFSIIFCWATRSTMHRLSQVSLRM